MNRLWGWLKKLVRLYSGATAERVTTIETTMLVIPTITRHVGTRALDTIYQNTSGRPRMCLVTVRCTRKLNNEYALAIGNVSNLTPPAVDLGIVGLYRNAGTESYEVATFMLTIMVPNLYYYRVARSLGGTATVVLTHWVEVDF